MMMNPASLEAESAVVRADAPRRKADASWGATGAGHKRLCCAGAKKISGSHGVGGGD